MTLLAASLFAVSLPAFTPQPDTLTLEACYRDALANWPSVVQAELKRSIADLQTDNLGSRYLPAVSVSGRATYHTKVVTFPFDLPGVATPGIPNDQYALSLDLDQLIYDGGEISTRKRLAAIDGNLGAIETDVVLHQVRDRVNGLFFQALLLQSEISLTASLVDDLESRLGLVRAGVEGGVALRRDADVLQAELIKVRQDVDDARMRRNGKLAALAQLTGRSIRSQATLVAPDVTTTPVRSAGRRPEFDLFAEQTNRIVELEELSSSNLKPRLSGFSQAGVGSPPDLDIFEKEFAPYLIVGVRLNWTFWDWSQTNRERQIRQIERKVIASEEETFARQLAIEAEIQLADINRLDSVLVTDEEIIALRTRIADDAAVRLENGIITATDFLIERNQAHRAKLRRAFHEIQLVAARTTYATTIGAYL